MKFQWLLYKLCIERYLLDAHPLTCPDIVSSTRFRINLVICLDRAGT